MAKEVPGISAVAAKKIPLRRNNKLLAKAEVQANTWSAVKKLVKAEVEANQADQSSTYCAVGAASSSRLLGGGQQSAVGAAGSCGVLGVSQQSAEAGGWLGVTNDPDELELLAQFQRKLAELRANKASRLIGAASPEPAVASPQKAWNVATPPKSTGLQLTPSGDGKWKLVPKPREVKPEPTEPAVQQEVKQESKTEPQDDDSDCLDDFTKASVTAFRKRKATKAKVARLLKRPSASLKDESAGGKPAKAERKTKV